MDEIKNRRPHTKKKYNGVIQKSSEDAIGICDPLERYGELNAAMLAKVSNAIRGRVPHSNSPLRRLKQLFHNSQDMPLAHVLIRRPKYQYDYGPRNQTFYQPEAGSIEHLMSMGLYDPTAARIAAATRIVQIPRSEYEPTTPHDQKLAIAAASLEIALRREPGHEFITHIEIIKNAPHASQYDNPLAIPVPRLTHTFRNGKTDTLEESSIEPDFLFGDLTQKGALFGAFEFDNSTETIEPSYSLKGRTWLRKVLCYSEISRQPNVIYKTYLNIPNINIFASFTDLVRMRTAMAVTKRYALYPKQWRFKYVGHIAPLRVKEPIDDMLTWLTLDDKQWRF